MRGSPGEHATICAAGVAAALAYLWLPDLGLVIIGGGAAAVAGAALVIDVRRGRDWHRRDALVRDLWVAANRIPAGRVLTDPRSGDLLSAERGHGRLTLVVTGPPGPGKPSVTARYVVGHRGAPVRPPLRRSQAGDSDPIEVTAAELHDLIEQVTRTAVLGAAR